MPHSIPSKSHKVYSQTVYRTILIHRLLRSFILNSCPAFSQLEIVNGSNTWETKSNYSNPSTKWIKLRKESGLSQQKFLILFKKNLLKWLMRQHNSKSDTHSWKKEVLMLYKSWSWMVRIKKKKKIFRNFWPEMLNYNRKKSSKERRTSTVIFFGIPLDSALTISTLLKNETVWRKICLIYYFEIL